MNTKITPLYTLAVIFAVGPLDTGCESSNEIVEPPAQWVLTRSDNFDSGTSPSPELWTIETGYGDNGWGNDEWQLYTDSPDNVRVEDGNLVISAQSECRRVELATNGGFETGNLDGWTLSCESNNGTCAATMDEAKTGDWSGNVAAGAEANPLIKQEGIGIGIVLPNTEVTVEFALLGSATDGGQVVAEFFSEVDGGDPSKTEILGGDPIVSSDEWVSYRYTVTTGDDVSGGVTLQLKTECREVENGAGGNGGAGGAGGNGEHESCPANVYFDDVTIKPSCGKRDGSITSARIKTQVYDCDGDGDGDDGKCGFEQKYGRFEARIKLPEGRGLWPAFWMLGGNIDEVPWPGCGEIDVMENFVLPEVVSSALHGPGYSGAEAVSSKFSLPDGEIFADDFHVFAVEWDPGRIAFSVDSQLYRIIPSSEVSARGDWVFDHEFFVLLNLAVGGNPVPDPDLSGTSFPAEMLIDYVRIFERAQ